jgi:hypothetical protein
MRTLIEQLGIGEQVYVVDLINYTINKVEIEQKYEKVFDRHQNVRVRNTRGGEITSEIIPGETECYRTYEEAKNSPAYQYILKNGLKDIIPDDEEGLDAIELAKKQQKLRDEHHYSVEPYSIKVQKLDGTIDRWLFNVIGLGKDSFVFHGGLEEHYNSYEEALSAGIKYTEENLVNKK